jgi:hypothetical protein
MVDFFNMRSLKGWCTPVATTEGSVNGLVKGIAIVRMPGVAGLCRGCERLHTKPSRSVVVARPGKLGSRAFRASDRSARFTSISVAAASVSPSSSSLLCSATVWPHQHVLIVNRGQHHTQNGLLPQHPCGALKEQQTEGAS